MKASPGTIQVLYRGRLIEIVRTAIATPDGDQVFEFARRGPGTRIIFDRGDAILITKEYRYELGAYDLRLPGGKVFDSLEEYERSSVKGDPELEFAREAAAREGREEVGLDAAELRHVATSVCGATIKWDLYYFVTTKWQEVPGGQKLEHGEQISYFWMPKKEVAKAALNGSISEDRSALQLIRHLHAGSASSRADRDIFST